MGNEEGLLPKERQVDSMLVVTGNQNVGKSVIFQLLTGRYAAVSNYPGTTVEISEGTLQLGGSKTLVCDTPGLNSLFASSEDELVARDMILKEGASVLQVADAKNLQRALILTIELSQAGIPLVLDLNMIDEARERRIYIDSEKLSALLGVPVVPTIATQRYGLDRLKNRLQKAGKAQIKVRYPEEIEEAASQIEKILPDKYKENRLIPLLLLCSDKPLIDKLSIQLDPLLLEQIRRIVESVQSRSARPISVIISETNLREARRICDEVITSSPSGNDKSFFKQAGDIAMHPVFGVPVLFGILFLMYFLVGDIAAQRGVDFLEEVVFGRFLIPPIKSLVGTVFPAGFISDLLIGDYGLLTMALPYAFAIILPIVGMFFLCFGFLEDVGYLPRLAVMANKACRLIGLNGKAVLPLVLGLGCGSMATLTSRILDSKRDRILVTFLLALCIPCSAQLGVIMAMLSPLSASALFIWILVISAVILTAGQIASRLIPGESSPFVYEIPPLRRPKLSNIVIKTAGRIEWYVREAVPLFFLGTLILFLLDATGAILYIEDLARPIVAHWLGLPVKATEAFIVGFLRRDFGAAGFFALSRAGELSGIQTLVSIITITLFVPCFAQYLMMIKERGWKMASVSIVLIVAIAFLIGGLVFRAVDVLGISI